MYKVISPVSELFDIYTSWSSLLLVMRVVMSKSYTLGCQASTPGMMLAVEVMDSVVVSLHLFVMLFGVTNLNYGAFN